MSMKHRVEGTYKSLEDKEMKDMLEYIVSHYHLKTDKIHNDGSVGDIKITLYEFLDLLASMYSSGVSTGEDAATTNGE